MALYVSFIYYKINDTRLLGTYVIKKNIKFENENSKHLQS